MRHISRVSTWARRGRPDPTRSARARRSRSTAGHGAARSVSRPHCPRCPPAGHPVRAVRAVRQSAPVPDCPRAPRPPVTRHGPSGTVRLVSVRYQSGLGGRAVRQPLLFGRHVSAARFEPPVGIFYAGQCCAGAERCPVGTGRRHDPTADSGRTVSSSRRPIRPPDGALLSGRR